MRLAVLLAALLGAGAGEAARFRSVVPIASPQPSPAGFTRVADATALPAGLVAEAIRDFLATWNSGRLRGRFSERFYDGDRLVDQIARSAPRDARIRLLALESVQQLAQYAREEGPGTRLLVSEVSALVRTQVEFDDPSSGFQRLEGRNELLFTVTVREGP